MKNAKQKILLVSAAVILAAVLTASAGCTISFNNEDPIEGTWVSEDLIYDYHTNSNCNHFYYFYNDNTGEKVWNTNSNSYEFTWEDEGNGKYTINQIDGYISDTLTINGDILTDESGITYYKL
ncbi:MAG TPA: hypothetical protein O0W90_01165 [Methanocorpusculum sp.]|nr:hypothetical protein [Methanocorpusculum sp.]